MADQEMEKTKLETEELDGVAGGARRDCSNDQCPHCGHQGYKCVIVRTSAIGFFHRYTCPECGHTFTSGAPGERDTGAVGWKNLDQAKREHGVAELPEA